MAFDPNQPFERATFNPDQPFERPEPEPAAPRRTGRTEPFFRGAVGGTAGLLGGAMELAPGAVGRAGAAVSRFGQEQVQRAQEQSPVLGTAGSLAPALVPVGRALQAPSLGGRMLRGAGVGAAFGAATPTGQEEYGERLTEKALPAALGTALGGTVPAAISGGRAAFGAYVGRSEANVEQTARAAERLGFRLEPMQVRAERPGASPGFGAAAERNQSLANRLVTEAAGQRADKVTPEYIGRRLQDLGRQYDDIYIGPGGAARPRTFKIDNDTIDALKVVAEQEQRLAAGAVPGVRNIASDLVRRFEELQRQMPGARITSMNVPGTDLQRLRSELTRIYRTTTDNVDRGQAMNMLRQLDENVARNHPREAARLAELNPQYRTVLTLEKLAPYRGNVSLQQVGRWLESNDPMFARGASRHPLADLGRMGLDLNIRSVDEAVSRATPAGDIPIGRLEKVLGIGARTQLARAAQRRGAEPPRPRISPAGAVPVLGAGTEQE